MANQLSTLTQTELRIYDAVKFSDTRLGLYDIADRTSERLEVIKETLSNLIGYGLILLERESYVSTEFSNPY